MQMAGLVYHTVYDTEIQLYVEIQSVQDFYIYIYIGLFAYCTHVTMVPLEWRSLSMQYAIITYMTLNSSKALKT